MKIMCGILCRSRKRSSALIVSARSTSGSTTSTATSLTSNAPCASWSSSTEPGQSRIVQRSPRKLALATLSSVDIWRARASGEWSPTELPSRTLPRRLVLPLACSIASSRVVLPERYGPISAAQRGDSLAFAIGASIILRSRRHDREMPAGRCPYVLLKLLASQRVGNRNLAQLRRRRTLVGHDGLSRQRAAGAVDAVAGVSQHLGRGRVGDAEMRRQPEGAAMHRSDPRLFQQVADEILVVRDRLAGRSVLADHAGAGRINIEGAFGPRAKQARNPVQHVDDEVATFFEAA